MNRLWVGDSLNSAVLQLISSFWLAQSEGTGETYLRPNLALAWSESGLFAGNKLCATAS